MNKIDPGLIVYHNLFEFYILVTFVSFNLRTFTLLHPSWKFWNKTGTLEITAVCFIFTVVSISCQRCTTTEQETPGSRTVASGFWHWPSPGAPIHWLLSRLPFLLSGCFPRRLQSHGLCLSTSQGQVSRGFLQGSVFPLTTGKPTVINEITCMGG